MFLCDLPRRQPAFVTEVIQTETTRSLTQRLTDIGFVSGEPLTVVAHAPWGGDPILVQIAGTRFALRRNEAKMVRVEVKAS